MRVHVQGAGMVDVSRWADGDTDVVKDIKGVGNDDEKLIESKHDQDELTMFLKLSGVPLMVRRREEEILRAAMSETHAQLRTMSWSPIQAMHAALCFAWNAAWSTSGSWTRWLNDQKLDYLINLTLENLSKS